ncbi:MAG: hypothetical protein ACRDRS_15505 [Pseudonocardiaceae bacterium]
MGRHHRERLGWLWPRLGAVVEVTVAELMRRAERERAHAHRARRVRVVPRQRPPPTPRSPAGSRSVTQAHCVREDGDKHG